MKPISAHTQSLACLAVISIVYLGAALGSFALSGLDNYRVGFWVADVAVYAILFRNPRINRNAALSAVFLTCLGCNLALGSSPAQSLIFAVVATLFVTGSLALTRRYQPQRPAQTLSIRELGAVILQTGIVSLLAGGGLGVMAFLVFERPLFGTGAEWFLASAVGVSTFLPFFLCVSRKRIKALRDPDILFPSLAWSAFCMASTALALSVATYPFVIVMVAMLMAASRLKPFELAIACMATGVTAMTIFSTGNGPDVVPVGYQAGVAITAFVPFLAGLMVRQIREDQRRIAASEERFRRAMDDSIIGILNVTTSGVIVDANPAMASILGYAPKDLEGKTVQELTYPPDLHIGNDILAEVRAGRRRVADFEKRYITKEGLPVPVRITFSLLESRNAGEQSICVSQVEDISARKRAEARVRELEDRWTFALASAGQGVWDMNVTTGSVVYSRTWTRMLGYGDNELDGDAEAWLALIHPDDRDAVFAADKAMMDGVTHHFEMEFRMRHKAGHWVWILDRGKVVERDQSGMALRAIGTMTDISNRKEVEARLQQSAARLAGQEERLRVTLRSIGDAVICVDADDTITFMNAAAEKLTRISEQHALGKHLRAVYVSIDDEQLDVAIQGPVDQLIEGKRAMLIRQDGSRCAIREVVSPLRTERGEVTGQVIVFQDFTNAFKLHEQLTHAASHDMLTGLANRSSFISRLTALGTSAQSSGQQHQLLYIDLDRFKEVNDGGGHAAGDALLIRAAHTIKSVVRGQDIVARLGGDEFAVVLHNCPQAFARIVAENIVDAISQLHFAWDGEEYRIGASIGIATLDAGNPEIDDVIVHADKACYSVKHAGRSGVATAPQDVPHRGKVISLTSKRDRN